MSHIEIPALGLPGLKNMDQFVEFDSPLALVKRGAVPLSQSGTFKLRLRVGVQFKGPFA